MKLNKITFLILLLPLFCFAEETSYTPWYTGPLIASGGENLEKNSINIQPYLHIKDTYGRYDRAFSLQAVPSTYTIHSEFYVQFGLTHWLDLAFDFNYFYTWKSGETSSEIADTFVEFGFQLLRGKDFTIRPWLRFEYELSLPSGKYEKLNPNKGGIDSSGSGTFDHLFKFIAAKTIFWIPNHPIAWRFNASYIYAPITRVKSFNTYGGGNGTDGKVNPGNSKTLDFSFEFSFTQKWVFAFEIIQNWVSKTTFRGTNGTNADGTEASNTAKSSDRTSIAPALEYNLNENLGIIAGVHMSIRERNSTEYTSGTISVTYTF